MARLETISASNECFSFCPCPLKCLMNVFHAQVKQGVCPVCLPPPFIRGCVSVETSSRGQRQRALLPGPPRSSHTGLQAPECCCANTGTLGLLGGPQSLGAPGSLRVADVWVPSSGTWARQCTGPAPRAPGSPRRRPGSQGARLFSPGCHCYPSYREGLETASSTWSQAVQSRRGSCPSTPHSASCLTLSFASPEPPGTVGAGGSSPPSATVQRQCRRVQGRWA